MPREFPYWIAGGALVIIVIIGTLAGWTIINNSLSPSGDVSGDNITQVANRDQPNTEFSPDNIKVFYIIPVSWTFAIYDENFNRIDKIEVNKGDVVQLVMLPSPFTPDELHEAIQEEFAQYAVSEGLVGSLEEFNQLHEEAEEMFGVEVLGKEYLPHGVAIRGLESQVNVDLLDGYPAVVTFVADQPGSYSIYCNVMCGWGHPYMVLEDAFVVNG